MARALGVASSSLTIGKKWFCWAFEVSPPGYVTTEISILFHEVKISPHATTFSAHVPYFFNILLFVYLYITNNK